MNQIPSLPELALEYGTINRDQLRHVRRLYSESKTRDKPAEFDQILVEQKFATEYQVGLLKLIREYLIIKKKGEEFGQIAVEKGFATPLDVKKALSHQRKEFKRAKIRKMIGDILVESRVITQKQKIAILREQTFLDQQTEKLSASASTENAPDLGKPIIEKEVQLSSYEKQFLNIKVLDQEFAASVIEKGLATKRQVAIASKAQEEAFEKQRHIRLLGDIMVELSYLTPEQRHLVMAELNRQDDELQINQPPKITVIISEDQMEARVEIDADAGPVSLDHLKDALDANGVKFGIYPDAILQCCLETGLSAFIAAKQDTTVELIKQRKARYHFPTDKIDTEVWRKGATLAEQHLGKESFLKKDLFGRDVEQKAGFDFTFRCGSGTRFSKDKTKAFAGKTGFPSLSIQGKLFVHPTISILEDADLKYGPIESWANMTVSGVLTGAYPVTAGNITAEEIRDAEVDAIGTVRSNVGITGSVIRTQGDVHARYLHNARIETFGNVYVENEIIDSDVFCSGKVDSANCRVIASNIYGKKGVELAGAGSSRTPSCIIGAGTEHHIVEIVRQVHLEEERIKQEIVDLKEKRDEQERFSQKTFQKMIELKIFHDRSKLKKQKLSAQFKKKKDQVEKEKLKNIVRLIQNFESRMENAIASLKELNKTKSKYDKEKNLFEIKIKKLEPDIRKKISDLHLDLFSYLEWTRKQENVPRIKIHQTAFQGTILKTIFASETLDRDQKKFFALEKKTERNGYELVIEKNQTGPTGTEKSS